MRRGKHQTLFYCTIRVTASKLCCRRLRCAAEMKQQQQNPEQQFMSTQTTASASASAACVSVTVSSEVSSQTIALRHDDSRAIDELLHAYRTSLETTQNAAVELEGRAASLADLINIAELSMRRVIAMTKQIGAFRSLPQTDQIQLLKTGSIELLILRSVITFDADKQHFLDPVDDEERQAMKLEQLRLAEDGTGMFDEQMKFVRSLTVELRADETTLVLLLVLSLFSPDRDNLTNRDYVSAEQERYCLLLKRYLESRYAKPHARFMFPRLIMKLTEIRSLNEEHTHVLLKLNPDGIQPLMKEVLDLRR